MQYGLGIQAAGPRVGQLRHGALCPLLAIRGRPARRGPVSAEPALFTGFRGTPFQTRLYAAPFLFPEGLRLEGLYGPFPLFEGPSCTCPLAPSLYSLSLPPPFSDEVIRRAARRRGRRGARRGAAAPSGAYIFADFFFFF